MKNGFFAYSSSLPFGGEVIEEAIAEINNSGIAKIDSWQQLEINGRFIINEIMSAVDKCDFFCADLTGFNDNVLFEIGYAIGRNKPIWLLIDQSHVETNGRFKDIGLFSTIGYSQYTNTNQITSAFYSDRPYEKKGSYDELIKNISPHSSGEPLLYLKNQVDTNYSQKISSILQNSKLTFILDDAAEIKIQTLSWYLSRIQSVQALLAEFSSHERAGHEIQNIKCSFLSGLAVGLKINVLMVAETPYASPLDYRELLKVYSTLYECENAILPFAEKIKNDFFSIRKKRKTFKETQRQQTKLQQISFGEFLAEHEEQNISNYYVETTTSSHLIKNEYNIVVGRKGSGKTATLFFIQQLLSDDKRNHITSIKPISIELDTLIFLLSNISEDFEKSYLIESAWKFLIYTEVAKSIYDKLKTKPIYALNESESDFISYIEKEETTVLEDFSSRLQSKLNQLQIVTKKTEEFKVKVSEILHIDTLSYLRDKIISVLDKERKIIVLIDNLDKSWKADNKIEIQCKWILGLLGVTGRVVREFSSSKPGRKKIGFNLTVFLRSDIFSHILRYAREPDKIEYTKLQLHDKEILFRIIEERFTVLNADKTPNDLWDDLLPKEIHEIKTKDYIFEKLIPRPRDIIFYFNKAKEVAIFRGHIKINQDDIIKAYEEY